MTKEKLKERLHEIEQNINKIDSHIKQLLANLNMLDGGKQECLHWLKELEKVDGN